MVSMPAVDELPPTESVDAIGRMVLARPILRNVKSVRLPCKAAPCLFIGEVRRIYSVAGTPVADDDAASTNQNVIRLEMLKVHKTRAVWCLSLPHVYKKCGIASGQGETGGPGQDSFAGGPIWSSTLSFFERGLRCDGLKVFESVLDDFAQVCLGLGDPIMECFFRCSSCRFCSAHSPAPGRPSPAPNCGSSGTKSWTEPNRILSRRLLSPRQMSDFAVRAALHASACPQPRSELQRPKIWGSSGTRVANMGGE